MGGYDSGAKLTRAAQRDVPPLRRRVAQQLGDSSTELSGEVTREHLGGQGVNCETSLRSTCPSSSSDLFCVCRHGERTVVNSRCAHGHREREGDMRLGKEETKGFIEEPAEVSPTQLDEVDTDPRREGEPTAAARPAPRDPEDQPTVAR